MTLIHLVRIVAAGAIGALAIATADARVALTRSVYFSATDASGASVTDLTAAELAVKEGGKDRTIVSVEPATGPMDVAIIIDDGGTGAFQAAAAELLNRLLGHGRFSLRLVNTQAIKIQDYTSDVDELRNVVRALGKRGRVQPDGDQLLDSVAEAARELRKREAVRPIIVVLTVYGESHQAVDPENVVRDLRASGASLNVLYVTGAITGQMIGDGTKQSGGRCEEVLAGGGIVPAAGRIADTLLHQLVVSYTLPDGVKPADRFALSVNRKGVSLLAPTRIPDR